MRETESLNGGMTIDPCPYLTCISGSIDDVARLFANLRVAKLEKEVFKLKQVDHSAEVLASIQSQVPSVVNAYLGTSLGDSLQKAAKSLSEYELKNILYDKMHESQSHPTHDTNQELYDALAWSIKLDENNSTRGRNPDTVLKKIDRRDDQDEDSSAGQNQGKKTKRRRTKESESSKKASTTKETSNGKAPTKVQVVDDAPEEHWFNNLLSAKNDPLTFDALMAIPIDFSKFSMNRLKIDKLTKAHLEGPNNPEEDHFPFDLTKPLPLKGRPGRLTVVTEYLFNNDLEFLKSSDPEKKYTTSITKTKTTRYKIVGIKDMKILSVVSVKVKILYGYGHLEEIVVRRADRQKYTFKEGDFVNLYLNDIEDMLLLAVQHKLFQLEGSDIVDFTVALCMFTRSLIIKRRVEDFSDGTLKTVRDKIHHRQLNFCLGYNKGMPRRKWFAMDKRRTGLMVELIDKQLHERRIIRNLERLVGSRKLEMDYRLMT
ncbi:hypothetical protein Tco_0168748 [Tanacetum coccineum]